MHLLSRVLLAAYLLAPALSQAAIVTSTCQTVVAVENAWASNGIVYLYLSPGVGSPCLAYAGASVIEFEVGQGLVTSTNINSIVATALSAYVSGHQLSVQYDNSAANCFGHTISIGGPNAAGALCP
jgi:hypothetical protein